MNVLWVTNVALPEASLLMNEKPVPFGGWFASASIALANEDDIKLAIAFPKKGLNDMVRLKGKKIIFYAFPPISEKEVKFNKQNICFKKILGEVKTDLVHIFGTEYPHALAMVNTCQEEKMVISIQGLMSFISTHCMAGIPEKVQNRFTIRDIVRQDTLKQQKDKFMKRGVFEIEALGKVKHIIGRTTWDRACTSQINPDAEYHFCNETLRDEFYKHTWEIEKCEKHSIFISQGSYPIKGLHFMLEAMPLIIKNYPNVKLYVGGNNITKSDTIKDKLKISYYGKYIKELIEKYNLQKNVLFTGILDEKQMCERYLQSHVFVCPSSIENSPNSLGEAMILGVPCVASGVGGITDLLKHKEEGFVYQADAPYMLAHYVCEIFGNDELALNFSNNARKHAKHTHDKNNNLQTLLSIYNKLISNDYNGLRNSSRI
jgi:glycosyltransferase involved in cell wall biosynthesis